MKAVSLDIGFGMVKAYTRNGEEEVKRIFPSITAPASAIGNKTGDRNGRGAESYEVITVDNETYYVGDKVTVEAMETRGTASNSQDSKRVFSKEYKVLIAASLVALGINDEEVGLALELPLSDYKNFNGELAKAYKDKKIIVKAGVSEHTYHIKDVVVTGQGIAALYNTVKYEDLENGLYGIIEIGSKTTDYARVEDMEYAETATNSVPLAMSNVIEALKSAVDERGKEKLNQTMNYPRRRLEKLITGYVTGKKNRLDIQLGKGEPEDFTEEFKKIVENVATSIYNSVINTLAGIQYFKGLVLAGGGALVMRKVLEEALGNQVDIMLPDDPQFANVIGAFDMYMDILDAEGVING